MIKICSDLKAVNSLPLLLEEINIAKLDSSSYACQSQHIPSITEFWLSFYGGIFKVVVFTDEPLAIASLSNLLQSHKLPPPSKRKLSKKEELELAKAELMAKASTKCRSGLGSTKFRPGSKYCR